MRIFWALNLFLSYIALQHFSSTFGSGEWDYGENGPKTKSWCQQSVVCCQGINQSPIDLIPNAVKDIIDIKFQDYDKEIKLFGLNNGHTVVFSQDPQSDKKIQPTMSKGGLEATYTFHSLHFHWGSKDSVGSEHFLNGKQFPMELHLVHYRSDFRTINEALESKQPYALAVLGVFYTISDEQSSQAIETISQSLPSISKPLQTTNFNKTIKLMDLLPRIKNYMFRYLGSLTTPDCNEVVAWTIFGSQHTIRKSQMNNFRELKGKESSSLSNNYRPLQQFKKRQVLVYGRKPIYY